MKIIRAIVDLSNYEFDKTHHLKLPIENGTGLISLLISLTGISNNKTNCDTESMGSNCSINFNQSEKNEKNENKLVSLFS